MPNSDKRSVDQEGTSRPKSNYRTAEERRDNDRERQQKHRKKAAEESRKYLNFTISKRTAGELDIIRKYAEEQNISFSYESFFSPWVKETASRIRRGRDDNSTFQEFAAVILSAMPGAASGTAVYTENQFIDKFIEIYGDLEDAYPEQFPPISFDELRDMISMAKEIANEKYGFSSL